MGFIQPHFFSRIKKSGAGFTLIELLIVASIFAVAFLLATTVFVNVQSSQRGIAGRQRIVADGRYILEAMARTVRLGSVDYRYYRDPDGNGSASDAIDLTSPQETLAVRDQEGTQTCYRKSGTTLQIISRQSNCFSTAAATNITPSDIQVTSFQVIISPRSDPYLGALSPGLDCNVLLNPEGGCPCDDTLGQPPNIEDDIDTSSCLLDQRCVATGTEIGRAHV